MPGLTTARCAVARDMHNAMLSEQMLADLRSVLDDVPVEDLTTPQLVRAFTRIKCYFARGGGNSESAHARLDELVFEMRKRGILD